MDPSQLRKINEFLHEIPLGYRHDMRVPARIYADHRLLPEMFHDRSMEQLVNVATLPGIQKFAIAMPDMHEGYGFPIGGVAAMRTDMGVISPGGVGYDINCGVRLLATDMDVHEVQTLIPSLADGIFNAVPAGVGRGGPLKLNSVDLDAVLREGVSWAVEHGYASKDDQEHLEEQGSMPGADAELVSDHAKKRGRDQLGTLGSGNHFLEIQKVGEIFDATAASVFGLRKNQLLIMIHCGSRGMGHQICTDYVRMMVPLLSRWNIQLPDRELACAPVESAEGQQYLGAMVAAANFAWVNRTVIAWNIRNVFKRLAPKATIRTVYDVAHNIAKIETHSIDGVPTEVVMHRKGATRAFGPGREEVPRAYREIGQPVLIPGSMGTASYVMVGTREGMDAAFGTSCHGAGRRMSRAAAKRAVRGSTLRESLEKRGIVVRCDSDSGLAEEAPEAYKDVDAVVGVVHRAGLATLVARLEPVAVIKGG